MRESIEQLRTSDGWQACLKARRRFPSYSWLMDLDVNAAPAALPLGEAK